MKKFLTTFGVLLLVGAAAVGIWTFVNRHKNNELVPENKKVTTSDNKTDDKETPTTTPEPSFDKTKFSTKDPVSPWVVVNKKHPLNPQEYAPGDLVAVGGGQYMRAEAATALASLIAAAKAQALTINPLSGYRSYATQVNVYNNEVSTYGKATADSESARPGYSEHQTGWAIDVGSGGCGIEDCFGNTTEGKWIAEHAYEYGFIIRYTAAKQDVTGYRAEPWHIRYIGTELAKELHDKNITTLEEFFNVAGGDYAN